MVVALKHVQECNGPVSRGFDAKLIATQASFETYAEKLYLYTAKIISYGSSV